VYFNKAHHQKCISSKYSEETDKIEKALISSKYSEETGKIEKALWRVPFFLYMANEQYFSGWLN
jgi:hypothetical protein